MSIENALAVSEETDPKEMSHFARWAMSVSLHTCAIMWLVQKVPYALQFWQIKLAPYTLVMVLFNPTAPVLANLHDRYSFWLYLTIGGLRSCLFMPTSYVMGKYSKEFALAWAARREHRTGRQLSWPAKVRRWTDLAKRWVNRAAVPARDRSVKLLAASSMLSWSWGLLKKFGRWLKKWVLGNFRQWGWILVFIRPNGWMLMVAGAKRMNPWVTGAAAVSGELVWLVLVAYMGEHIPHFVLNVFSVF